MWKRTLGNTVSRRRFLGGAGAVAAASVVGASPAAAAESALDDGAGWQGGVFGGLVSEREFRFRRNFNGEASVYTLADDAKVFHGGGPAAIGAFSDGEEMTVFVADGEGRVVTEVEHLVYPVRATIDARHGETLKAGGATLTIGDETRVVGPGQRSDRQEERMLDQLGAGDQIVAVGRRLPNRKTMELGIVKADDAGGR